MQQEARKGIYDEEKEKPRYVTLYLGEKMYEHLEEVVKKTGEKRSNLLKRALSTELLFWYDPYLVSVERQMERLGYLDDDSDEGGVDLYKSHNDESHEDKLFRRRKTLLRRLALEWIKSGIGREIEIPTEDNSLVAKASQEHVTLLSRGGGPLGYLLMKASSGRYYLRISLQPIIEYVRQNEKEGKKNLRLTLRLRSPEGGSEREVDIGEHFRWYMETVEAVGELGQEIHDFDIAIDEINPGERLVLLCEVDEPQN